MVVAVIMVLIITFVCTDACISRTGAPRATLPGCTTAIKVALKVVRSARATDDG